MRAQGTLSLRAEILPIPDQDAPELERLTQRLRRELGQLEVESIEPIRRAVPSHAKSAMAAELGQLLIVVLPAVLPKLVEFLQAWCLRNRTQKIVIEHDGLRIEFPPGGLDPKALADTLDELNRGSHADDESTRSLALRGRNDAKR